MAGFAAKGVGGLACGFGRSAVTDVKLDGPDEERQSSGEREEFAVLAERQPMAAHVHELFEPAAAVDQEPLSGQGGVLGAEPVDGDVQGT